MVAGRSRAAGTGCSWRSTIWPARSKASERDGVAFRNEIVTGPGGLQILLEDPAGNVVELFQPAQR